MGRIFDFDFEAEGKGWVGIVSEGSTWDASESDESDESDEDDDEEDCEGREGLLMSSSTITVTVVFLDGSSSEEEDEEYESDDACARLLRFLTRRFADGLGTEVVAGIIGLVFFVFFL